MAATPERVVRLADAADFYRFVADDLVPWVESSFRAASGDRTLVGVSRGGVFALSTLFLHPGTFRRTIAISPTVEPPIYDYLAAYAEREDPPPGRFCLSAGSEGQVETGIAAQVWELTGRLGGLSLPSLDWTVESFPGESHVSVVPRALVEGLVAVFSETHAPGEIGASGKTDEG